jgi:hypothetical protein
MLAIQRPEIAFDEFDIILHAAFEPGAVRQTRIDDKAIVLCQTVIHPIHHRVGERSFDNRRLEVVRDHPFGHAAEELKGMHVAHEKHFLLLAEHQLPVCHT